jgi:hypothetical protein
VRVDSCSNQEQTWRRFAKRGWRVKAKKSRNFALWATVISLLVPLALAQSYTITDLGLLPGSYETTANGVNDFGQVVGWAGFQGENVTASSVQNQTLWTVSTAGWGVLLELNS